MSQGFLAKGTQLRAGGTASLGVAVLIPEFRSIKGPGMDSDEVEATNMDTPGDFKDWIPGLKDWGTLTGTLQWIPGNAMHQQLYDDFVASPGVQRFYALVLPNAIRTFTFKGFVKSMPLDLNFASIATMEVTLRIVADPIPTLV